MCSTPVEQRVKQLDSTGVPLPFEIFATMQTSKYKQAEKLIHSFISKFTNLRIRNNREFFNVKPEEALEIFKQVAFTFGVKNGIITADYQWYAFPFQFCSTPMFVALLAAVIPSKRFYRAAVAFLATYGIIAGVLVMAVPDTVFIDIIGVNVQTMVHHGSQITIGFFLLHRAHAIEKLSSALGGTAIFLSAITIALILNCTVIRFIPEGEVFNMFFISPYFNTTLPVYCNIQPKVPYPVFLFLYIFPYVTVALGMHAFVYPLPRLIARRRTKKVK
jgi:hypothetical protein